jgi:hypothetical protein
MDRTLGVCGDTFEELVIRAFSGSEQLNPILGSKAWGVCLGTPYGVPVVGTLFLVDT